MTEVSPSSKKVDDFLSSISELSQERLREDQKRQRDLQRNIDALRSRSNSSSPVKSSSYQSSMPRSSSRGHDDIPSLKFNRSLRSNNENFSTNMKDLDEDKPPEMPQRPDSARRQYRSSRGDAFNETPPPMPRRPAYESEESPPPMPLRRDIKKFGPPKPSKPSGMSSKFDIELINPIPMKTKPELLSKRDDIKVQHIPKSPLTEGQKYRSFTELENDIRKGSDVGGKTKDMVDDLFAVNSISNTKPLKPIKSYKLSTKPNSKDKVEGTPNVVPKPTYLNALSATKNQSEPSSIQSSISSAKQRYIPEHNNPNDVSIIKSSSPQREKKQNSWIDSAIKKNDTPESPVKAANRVKDSPTKHVKSSEPEYLSSLARKKSPDTHNSDSKTPPKPPKPSLETYTKAENELLKSQMQKLSSSKNKSAPPKPVKPSISKYEEQDTEVLKLQMQKLSHGKNAPPKPSKPSPKKYQEEDNAILLSQMKKLGRNSNSSITRGSTQQTNPEGLAALAKLKPVKTVPSPKSASSNSIPEPIKKLEHIKTSDKSVKKSPSPERAVAAKTSSSSDLSDSKSSSKGTHSFQDQLSSIIRASTVPNVRASKPAANIPRANTLPLHENTAGAAQSKLTHPNKGRSKGPKRRLPKKIAKNPSTADNAGSASAHANANSNHSTTQIIDFKHKKVPPPVNKASKQKALDNLKPSRNFSGELFI
ncbi:DEHA2B15004p [Debaryomyces hansenii CBS767]|uniref:DEHA2B15004p n=1 Tax=Debaryomyces hansenii (strain ATCC 36239 / CBS 767 / BCRC 21394 / JCM 1990 / NBRC 0083 / IGC 2968) TaxID=284592 RepID=Q6BW19_DEBHA|nr:DEHA2B15004p [Debaryomyces hansenii CBS767]CAG85611.2 DEHA2B15004p [Debaryomyces hansenii CBS767]|eukprot:XP_457600.2 DEHA2B15004p [Debaryomyces hansenii CBS767]